MRNNAGRSAWLHQPVDKQICPCDSRGIVVQGAPWCFDNNAWTLSTEYLIEWGARWGPYMKSQPYRSAPPPLPWPSHCCFCSSLSCRHDKLAFHCTANQPVGPPPRPRCLWCLLLIFLLAVSTPHGFHMRPQLQGALC